MTGYDAYDSHWQGHTYLKLVYFRLYDGEPTTQPKLYCAQLHSKEESSMKFESKYNFLTKMNLKISSAKWHF